MLCNRIVQPVFTREQIIECRQCKHISGKKVWCCLFGTFIENYVSMHVPIILGARTKKRKRGCKGCGKKVKQIAQGYTRLATDGIGLTKEQPFVQIRIKICKQCNESKWILRTLWCMICKCFILAAARVKSKHCLLNKWPIIKEK